MARAMAQAPHQAPRSQSAFGAPPPAMLLILLFLTVFMSLGGKPFINGDKKTQFTLHQVNLPHCFLKTPAAATVVPRGKSATF